VAVLGVVCLEKSVAVTVERDPTGGGQESTTVAGGVVVLDLPEEFVSARVHRGERAVFMRANDRRRRTTGGVREAGDPIRVALNASAGRNPRRGVERIGLRVVRH